MTFNIWRKVIHVTYSTRQGRHFSETPTQDQRGSNAGCIHDWRGSQAIYQSATSASLLGVDCTINYCTYILLEDVEGFSFYQF